MIAETKPGQIYALIPKIMKAVGVIGKDRRNQDQGYAFRGIEDLYNAFQGPLSDNGVFVAPEVLSHFREERHTRAGGTLIYTFLLVKFRFMAPDGSCVEVTTVGEGMDTGDKSANKAMSAALKYAFTQTFCLATLDDADADQQSPPPSEKKPPVAPKSTPPVKPNHPGKTPPKSSPAAASSGPTEAQLKRLHAIKNRKGWKDEELKTYLAVTYGLESTRDLTRKQYDEVCATMERGRAGTALSR